MNLKFKLLILTLLVGLSTTASAQQYADDYIINKNTKKYHSVEMVYGVMAGVIIPSLSEKNDNVDIVNRAGYGIAMVWGVDFGKVKLLPEFWYTHSKSLLEFESDPEDYSLISNSIEVPIIVSLPIGNRLSFNIGPSFALMSNSKVKMDDGDEEDFGRTKSMAGYLVGFNLLLHKHIILDLRFSGRFVSVENEWYGRSDSYDYRYRNFSFNLGYRF